MSENMTVWEFLTDINLISGTPQMGTIPEPPRYTTNPYLGSSYSLHPELSRPGWQVLALRAAPVAAVATTYALSAYVESKAIEEIATNESTPSWWKALVFSGQQINLHILVYTPLVYMKLYWRVKRDGKWTWVAYVASEHIGHIIEVDDKGGVKCHTCQYTKFLSSDFKEGVE